MVSRALPLIYERLWRPLGGRLLMGALGPSMAGERRLALEMLDLVGGGAVLDVACGAGRHARWLAKLGFEVDAVDRAPELFTSPPPNVALLGADIEGGPWPYAGRRFDAIVVTNYLHRPLFPRLAAALAPGGVLIYETFAQGNETVGKPSRPDFLLAHGELLQAYATLRVVAYEDGFLDAPARYIQRIAAVRDHPERAHPRYTL